MTRRFAILAGAALVAALVVGTPTRADELASFATSSAADDRYWSDEFGLPDPDDAVTSAVAYGGGFVIGGVFHRVGDVVASNVALWDGTAWLPLGDGVDGPVRSLAVFRGELIASGEFGHAGGVAANGIARWDGHRWWPLGLGLQGVSPDHSPGAAALAATPDRLYAAGAFTIAGDAPASSIAMWDGASWSAVGGGLDAEAGALLPGGGDTLYVGGRFAHAGGVAASGVALWDGHAWSALGDGVTLAPQPFVYALARYRGRLVVTGWFDEAGGQPIRNIAAWDGAAWSSLDGANFSGQALLVRGDSLLVGGPGVPVWDGIQWRGFEPVLWGNVGALSETPLGLVVGGAFIGDDGTGNVRAGNVGLVRDGAWRPLGSWSSRTHGFGSLGVALVRVLASYRGELIASGIFHYAGSDTGRVTLPQLGRWDGHSWRPFSASYNRVETVTVAGDTLFAGGNFVLPPTYAPSPAARFDGSTWTAFDTLTFDARCIAHADGVTYIGGYGGNGRGVIHRSSGGPWEDISGPAGARTPGIVALLASGSRLYAGGIFDSLAGIAAPGIAMWDGHQWSVPGHLERGFVLSLCECDGSLYAGGAFRDSTGAHAVMRWNGLRWEPLDARTLDMRPSALACVRHQLYAAGAVYEIGGGTERGVARWTGSDWQPLGSGTNGYTTAMAFHDGDLYVGGRFNTAGGHSAAAIARWRLADETLDQRLRTGLTGDPNPFTLSTSIAFMVAAPGRVRVQVHDVLGRRVAKLLDAHVASAGRQTVRWDGRDADGRLVAPGVYLVRIETSRGTTEARTVRLR